MPSINGLPSGLSIGNKVTIVTSRLLNAPTGTQATVVGFSGASARAAVRYIDINGQAVTQYVGTDELTVTSTVAY